MLEKITFIVFKILQDQDQMVQLLNEYSNLRNGENIQLINNKYLEKLKFNAYNKLSLSQKKYMLNDTFFHTERFFNFFVTDSSLKAVDIFKIAKFQDKKHINKALERSDISTILEIDIFKTIEWFNIIKNPNNVTELLIQNDFLHDDKLLLQELDHLSVFHICRILEIEEFRSTNIFLKLIELNHLEPIKLFLIEGNEFLMQSLIEYKFKELYNENTVFKSYVQNEAEKIKQKLNNFEISEINDNKHKIISMLHKYNIIKYFKGETNEMV